VKSFDLKVAYLVDYKNIVPPRLKKTDTALIAALIYKF
jgi:putative salt-induced outer membrane protein YdiY